MQEEEQTVRHAEEEEERRVQEEQEASERKRGDRVIAIREIRRSLARVYTYKCALRALRGVRGGNGTQDYRRYVPVSR